MKKACWLLVCISFSLLAQEGPSVDELLLADGLYARGFFEMALREYERLLEAYPEFENRRVVLFRAAESARRQDRPTSAKRLYQEVLAQKVLAQEVLAQEVLAQEDLAQEDLAQEDPGHLAARSLLRLADMAFDEQDFHSARANAHALFELNPLAEHAAAALHMLASASWELGERHEARQRQIQLLRDYPDDPHAAYAAMMLARSEPKSNFDERRQWYAVALRNPPSPDLEVEALWGLGMLELDAGEVLRASERFHRVWRAHPDHPRVQTGFLTIAWTLMMAERYEDALQASSETPARRKGVQPDSWLYLEAVCLRNTQRNDEAYRRWIRLMETFPESRFRARTAFDLAVIYAEREEHRRVLALADDILSYQDRRADALWLLAESERALGNTEEALKRYAELAAESPATPRSVDAAFQRAILLRRKDPRAAADALTQFATAHPDDPRAFSSLRAAGTLWLEQSEPNRARRVWELVISQYPEDTHRFEVEFALAMMELREGNANEARRLFSILLVRDPQGPRSTTSAYWLAILAADAGQESAEGLIREALQREPSVEHVRALRLRLARLLETRGEVEAAESEYLALLAESGAPGLSDTRLIWMLRQARERQAHEIVAAIAGEMTASRRSRPTREMGFYARAEASYAKGDVEDAIEAWRTGLAFEIQHRQAAEAALALGGAFMDTDTFNEAEPYLQRVMRWGATFEDARLQARGMMGLGDLLSRRGDWNEAARMYMGIAVLFDDAELTPVALHKAADAFTRAGRETEAEKARQELKIRYPDSTETP